MHTNAVDYLQHFGIAAQTRGYGPEQQTTCARISRHRPSADINRSDDALFSASCIAFSVASFRGVCLQLVPRLFLAVAPPTPLHQSHHQPLLHLEDPDIRHLAAQPREVDSMEAILSAGVGIGTRTAKRKQPRRDKLFKLK